MSMAGECGARQWRWRTHREHSAPDRHQGQAARFATVPALGR